MNILQKILEHKKVEIESLKVSYPVDQLITGISEKNYDNRSLYNSLSENNINIIAIGLSGISPNIGTSDALDPKNSIAASALAEISTPDSFKTASECP